MPLRVTRSDLRLGTTFGIKVQKATVEAARRKIVTEAKRQSGTLVKRSFLGLQGLVHQRLTTGVQPVSPGVKAIAYTSPVTGKNRRFVTVELWEQLTRDYAQRYPRSVAFWRKHFNISQYPKGRTPVVTLYERAMQQISVRSGRTRTSDISRRRVELSWTLSATAPDNALADLLFFPMFEATELYENVPVPVQYAGTPSRDDVSMLVWVEAERPFIAGLSAKVGSEMYGEMRRLLARVATT